MSNRTTPGGEVTSSTAPWTLAGLTETAEILNFVAYFICFLIGTTGNSFALHFFLNKKKDLATIIYIFISFTDLLVSILMLPISLPFVGKPRNSRYMYLLEKVPLFCNIWGFLWYTSTLMTVFLVAIVSITRCICISSPLAKYFLNKKLVVVIVVLYSTLISSQATIPYWVGKRYEYYPDIGICTWTNHDVLSEYKTAYKVYAKIYAFEFYALILPILVSSAVTIFVLNRPSSQMSKSNRTVTVTVLCFTSLYIVCNIPPCLVQLLLYLKTSTGLTDIDISWLVPYGFTSTSVVTVGANSALNSCVYIWRTEAFREHLLALIKCRKNTHQDNKQTWGNSMAYVMKFSKQSGIRRNGLIGSLTAMSPCPTSLHSARLNALYEQGRCNGKQEGSCYKEGSCYTMLTLSPCSERPRSTHSPPAHSPDKEKRLRSSILDILETKPTKIDSSEMQLPNSCSTEEN